LILFGLIKKMVFADRFALIADSYFDAPRAVESPEAAWVGVFAFAMQIFFDFSGYTDIARGCALVLGFEFPVNFERPYLATSITDFWHRWHISLSTWLRDYLYVPLGGNRGGAWRTYRNLLLTMLLGGLWHGAAWTFVAWGAFHGGLLAVERAVSGLGWPEQVQRWWRNPLLWAPRAIGTFVVVCVGWVLFRARSFADARYVLETMFDAGSFAAARARIEWDPALVTGVGLALGIALLEERFRLLERLLRAPWPVQTAVYLGCLWGLEFFSVLDQSIPYVYFQF
jgi:D-alanyl-lipoteichoic acid acyltransferase DltB (MBOAT superfamily)